MQHRLAALWCLLMDLNHATAIALAARSIYNYHCGDLVETFGNLISLQWSSPSALSPGGNINQLAVNILRRILTADIEHYTTALWMHSKMENMRSSHTSETSETLSRPMLCSCPNDLYQTKDGQQILSMTQWNI